MALPPNIPTSFVPKQPVSTQPRRKQENGVLYYGALFLLGAAVVGAGLTFGYQKYLESVQTARKAKLEQAEKSINVDTVESFIRLRNRIHASESLLNQHVYATQFFDVLEKITLQNVRYQSLILSIGEDRTAKIEMHGIARSFNALAAESAEFAKEKRIKRAIFSNISADKNGVVTFALRAELDPKLLLRTAEAEQLTGLPPAANIATSTDVVAPVNSTAPATTTSVQPKATTTKP